MGQREKRVRQAVGGATPDRQLCRLEFDALTSDHGDDFFLLLVGELLRVADSQDMKAESLMKSAERLGAALLAVAAKLWVRSLLGGAVDPADLNASQLVAVAAMGSDSE